MPFIRFAARDPGGANVLAGLLPSIKEEFDFAIWALPAAALVFERAGFQVSPFAENPHWEELQAKWRKKSADALITGTSHYDPFESVLWQIAGRDHCRSLAVLDSWSNLAVRFRHRRPDFVGAIDRGQIEELEALGFDPSNVLLTGHPWLSAVTENAAIGHDQMPARRGDIHILFVSEAIAGDVAQGSNEPFGFDEFDSFSVVHLAAAEVAKTGKNVQLAIKFHPYEDPKGFLERLETLPRQDGLTLLPLRRTEKPHPWVLWADLVTGVGSMLLLEAVVLGRPVISVQPGLEREDTFVASQRGCARTLTVAVDGEAALRELIVSEQARSDELDLNRRFLDLMPRDSTSAILNWLRGISCH